MDSFGVCDPLCSVDDMSSEDFKDNYQPKTDFLKAVAVIGSAIAGTVAINHSWVAANQVCFSVLSCTFKLIAFPNLMSIT